MDLSDFSVCYRSIESDMSLIKSDNMPGCCCKEEATSPFSAFICEFDFFHRLKSSLKLYVVIVYFCIRGIRSAFIELAISLVACQCAEYT